MYACVYYAKWLGQICALIVCCLLEHVLKKECVCHLMYCCYVTYIYGTNMHVVCC